jgi:polysaccharide deacetylase 2 family uncharacterized protein YibQ
MVVGVLVLTLAGGLVVLDRHQAGRGRASLFALPWTGPRSTNPPAAEPASIGTPARGRPQPSRTGAPRSRQVALLVDQVGARADVFDEIVALGRPLTVGILPDLPLSRRLARDAVRAGLEVVIQLPLEPYRFPEVDPGPGTLLVSMTPEDLGRRTRRVLAGLPEAVGVATGMGSRFTEDRVRMRAVLEAVAADGRYFVDGLTSAWSVGFDEARELGIRAGRRQILLDPDEEEATMRARLEEVERWADRRGTVLVVAHGRRLTVRLLAEALPRWETHGLRLVPVSTLLGPGAPRTPRAVPVAIRALGAPAFPAHARTGSERG